MLVSTGLSAAQAGHRQDWPRALSGICARVEDAMLAPMHQQSSGGVAAMTAHWLLRPHNGQRVGSGSAGRDMRQCRAPGRAMRAVRF